MHYSRCNIHICERALCVTWRSVTFRFLVGRLPLSTCFFTIIHIICRYVPTYTTPACVHTVMTINRHNVLWLRLLGPLSNLWHILRVSSSFTSVITTLLVFVLAVLETLLPRIHTHTRQTWRTIIILYSRYALHRCMTLERVLAKFFVNRYMS